MHLTILALGSRGDVQPYVALGAGLHRAGYDVRVSTFESFRPLVEGAGLDFHPVKGDAQTLTAAMGGQSLSGGSNPFSLMRAIQRSFGRVIDDYIEAFSSDALWQTNAIISQLPGGLFGFDLAQKLNVPYITASVIPLTPTRAWPLTLFPQLPLGNLYNRLTYPAAQRMLWFMFARAVNRFRNILSLPPTSYRRHFGQLARMPVLNGFSPRVVPRPPDWGDHIHVTGWWLLDESGWTPPDSLLRFLEAGTPPVFVGFGSMPVPDPAALVETILTALHQSGQRGLLSSGWAGLDSNALPETVYKIGYTPYAWLLPRCAAAVHHGGSGTTGFGLRSGVPSMVVPFGADQFYWGKRIADLGVGAPPIPLKSLTAERLTAALHTMATDQPMRQRTALLGEQLRAEDGIGNAVRVVEQFLTRNNNFPTRGVL